MLILHVSKKDQSCCNKCGSEILTCDNPLLRFMRNHVTSVLHI